jgi:mannan endo-1,4-beta-mannosidase
VRTPHLITAMSVLVAAAFGYAGLAAALAPHRSGAVPGATARAAPSASAPAPAYDVTPLLRPARDFLGVAITGAPADMSRVDAFARRIGGRPNMITIYESFDDDFAAAEVRKIYRYGALPILRWEPFTYSMRSIAAGRADDYLSAFAQAVRRVDVPVALTVAHEMNGHWYPWGTRTTTPKDFVAAWRHIHDVFARAGATNVIWTWTPNVVNYLRAVPLKPLWPGDDYVDWVGVDGYFTYQGEQTYRALFGRTLTEVRAFTDKPELIVETGAEPGAMRARAVRDLFASVAADPRVIGFVYFDQKGSADWVVDHDPATLTVFRAHPRRDDFGFTVR